MKHLISFILIALFGTGGLQASIPQIKMSEDGCGLSSLSFDGALNYIDDGKHLGDLNITYVVRDKKYDISLADYSPQVLENVEHKIVIFWQLPADVRLYQTFIVQDNEMNWEIEIFNRGNRTLTVTDMSLPVRIGALNQALKAQDNLNRHFSLNGNASFLYWVPYSGKGKMLVMTMRGETSLEYASYNDLYYLHSMNAVDRNNDSWRIPSSSKEIQPYGRYTTGFNFSVANNYNEVKRILYNKQAVSVKVVPGMVVTPEMEVKCMLQSQLPIQELSAEYPEDTRIIYQGEKENGKYLYKFKFAREGENQIAINYGEGRKCYLDFFVTEPLETLIKKRSRFIVEKQQHTDSSKWYNGLYSLWDMERGELLSPDYLGDLREEFMVGGSDDPSNSKPIYVSEKNVVFPDKAEIASLEYYQKNFVWGKLQRTNDEYPYPYGIYGSENWYQNRSGKYGTYADGGSGQGRMWRTFDYTTHFAIYYNLYRIAQDNPEMVSYLDADGYLERAYRTAMAYFEVPYNIIMGKQWAFHGWCDWAYKQGNFHERYLLYIIDALKANGREEEANRLKKEWEKKVTYMIYEDPWPFGSEMYVDRTAFESSYYVAEYAKLHPIEPQEQLWYDKNKEKWYSYTSFDTAKIDSFMQMQLDGNLALRGLFEPGYANLGTAWSGQFVNLDYMTQMGGVAILDYAYKFSDHPAEHVNYGYNSLLASWALMNTGKEANGYGYWYKGAQNDGAVGWAFSPYQNSHAYMRYIKVGRKPWRYDGEIDHGLTGGIHGSGVYVVDDPDFGLICYGGNLTLSGEKYHIVPLDGVRRQLRFTDKSRFSLELRQDGFRKDTPICVKPEKELEFVIENRSAKRHNATMLLYNLTEGNYTVEAGGNKIVDIDIQTDICPEYRIEVPVSGKNTKVKLIKNNL